MSYKDINDIAIDQAIPTSNEGGLADRPDRELTNSLLKRVRDNIEAVKESVDNIQLDPAEVDVKDLADSEGLRESWSDKQDALGFEPEDSANRTETVNNDNSKYPTAKAVKDFVEGQGYATKEYVDAQERVTAEDLEPYATKDYVDDKVGQGGGLTPEQLEDLATKEYVDTAIDSIPGSGSIDESRLLPEGYMAVPIPTEKDFGGKLINLGKDNLAWKTEDPIVIKHHPNGGITYIATEAAVDGEVYTAPDGKDVYVIPADTDMKDFMSEFEYKGIDYGTKKTKSLPDGRLMEIEIPSSQLVTTRVTSLGVFGGYFQNSKVNLDLSTWDVSNVTNFRYLFYRAKGYINISNWQVKGLLEYFLERFDGTVIMNNWDVSSNTDFRRVFYRYEGNFPDLTLWDVSKGENFSEMFAYTNFNQPIGNWDVSKADSFEKMFRESPFNQPLFHWDVRKAYSFSGMFEDTVFNQDISQWDVSSAEEYNMTNFLNGNLVFDQDLSGWCVSKIGSTPSGFVDPNNTFMTVDKLPKWGEGCKVIEDGTSKHEDYQPPSILVNNITTPNGGLAYQAHPYAVPGTFAQNKDEEWFYIAKDAVDLREKLQHFLTYIDSDIDPSSHVDPNLTADITDDNNVTKQLKVKNIVTTFVDTFDVRVPIEDLPEPLKSDVIRGIQLVEEHGLEDGMYYIQMEILERYDFDEDAALPYMMQLSPILYNHLDLPPEFGIDIPTTTVFSPIPEFFSEGTVSPSNRFILNGDISNWDVSNVKSFKAAFADVSDNGRNGSSVDKKYIASDLSGWDVSSVETMENMFHYTDHVAVDMSNWDTSSVTNMSKTFSLSTAPAEISTWNTGNVRTMYDMFSDGIILADLSGWDVSNVTDMSKIFYYHKSSQSTGPGDLSTWCVEKIPSRPRDWGGPVGSEEPKWGERCSNEGEAHPEYEPVDPKATYLVHFSSIVGKKGYAFAGKNNLGLPTTGWSLRSPMLTELGEKVVGIQSEYHGPSEPWEEGIMSFSMIFEVPPEKTAYRLLVDDEPRTNWEIGASIYSMDIVIMDLTNEGVGSTGAPVLTSEPIKKDELPFVGGVRIESKRVKDFKYLLEADMEVGQMDAGEGITLYGFYKDRAGALTNFEGIIYPTTFLWAHGPDELNVFSPSFEILGSEFLLNNTFRLRVGDKYFLSSGQEGSGSQNFTINFPMTEPEWTTMPQGGIVRVVLEVM